MEPSHFHIVFTGLSGIPETPSAPVQRIIHLGKALASENWKVTYLNRLPLKHQPGSVEESFSGLKNINIEDSLKHRNSNNNKIGRLAWKIMAFPAEFFKLMGIHRKNRIDVLFIYTQYFGLVLFYSIIAKLLGCKTVLSYVEFRSGISTRNGFFIRLNDRLFDRYAFCLTNGVNPISHRIEQHVATVCPGKPQIRIPALCDFSLFNHVTRPDDIDHDYFLFCGTAGYFDVIGKIIKAFLAVNDKNMTKLQLVISGNDRQLARIRNDIKGTGEINMVSQIPYSDLVHLYSNALALVIPLRDIPQDNYRFPHKISEYTASKRPIITTNIGEIPFYFKDKESAIICADTSDTALTKAMEWAITYKTRLYEIGEQGYVVGLKNFSHKCFEVPLHNFLVGLLN